MSYHPDKQIMEASRLLEGPPTPPRTSSTLSPTTFTATLDKQSENSRTGLLTPPSSPLKSTSELSRQYPLLSDIPRKAYTGTTSLCDLLDYALDNMTELRETQNVGTTTIQARPISLLRCTNIPYDSPELLRYMRVARQLVLRIQGIIGMWGLGRFMRALRGSEDCDSASEKRPSVLNPMCNMLALRGNGSGSEAERLVSVQVDVRSILVEVGCSLKLFGIPASERKDALNLKPDWEKAELSRLADLLDMLLLSLVPAIEELFIDGIDAAQPSAQPFVPEGVVGRSITPAPVPFPTTAMSSAPTAPSTTFQLPPHIPSLNGSVRASSLRGIYPKQASDYRGQPDRLSTVTAGTTGTRDTFVYLARSMQYAAEVEGITEEQMGIGSPGRWGVSDDGSTVGENGKKPKWWSWSWSLNKKRKWGWRKLVGGCFCGAT